MCNSGKFKEVQELRFNRQRSKETWVTQKEDTIRLTMPFEALGRVKRIGRADILEAVLEEELTFLKK